MWEPHSDSCRCAAYGAKHVVVVVRHDGPWRRPTRMVTEERSRWWGKDRQELWLEWKQDRRGNTADIARCEVSQSPSSISTQPHATSIKPQNDGRAGVLCRDVMARCRWQISPRRRCEDDAGRTHASLADSSARPRRPARDGSRRTGMMGRCSRGGGAQ